MTPPRLSEDHLARVFARVVHDHADRPAARVLGEGATTWTYAELGHRVRALAQALVAREVQVGDRVALWAPNCPQWTVVDLACQAVGAVPVPVYPTATADEARHVVRHSGAVAIVVGGGERARSTALALATELADVRLVCDLEAADDPADDLAGDAARQDRAGTAYVAWSSLLATEDEALAAEVERRTAAGRPEDLATIIYTSGTTGTPKGVALSHRAMIHQIHAVDAFFDFGPDDSSLAFLPLSHALERAWTYFVLSHGALNTYVRDPKTVAAQLVEARPTGLVAVPKLYETVYATAQAMASRTPVRRHLFDWAVGVGAEVGRRRMAREPLPRGLRARLAVADRLVLHNIRDAVGGTKSVLAAGGAPLRREVEEFFWAGGLLVSQGYGMTETGPLMTFNCPGATRFGTVGRVIEGGEMRVGDEGELLYRGPNVMDGYWRDEEATREAVVDGWLRTGDVGEIDEDGFVTITDRLKDLVVTQQGKNVAPAPIEARIAEHPAVEHAVVIGDRRPCLVAMVQLADGAGDDALAQVRAHVDRINADLPGQEQIRAVEPLGLRLTTEDGLLTPTLKVRRRAVQERCAEQLDRMYAEVQRARRR
ncbi:AMP-dependent synthetase/ligase [Arsenicicoccus dermatophilus]|uniref:AMP-dependent synthetase/ligase n=1 Tax=Arsenicicoccus dermatophilus TaxID=1076331 RepID=UPI00391725D1